MSAKAARNNARNYVHNSLIIYYIYKLFVFFMIYRHISISKK